MSFLRKIALYIYVCIYVCANLYIRDANKYFNISSRFLVSRIFFFFFLETSHFLLFGKSSVSYQPFGKLNETV